LDHDYVSWEKHAYSLGQVKLLEADGEMPLSTFFYEMVFVNEDQDFTG